jgi:hypothetical protein
MGGSVTADETPGGGATFVVGLRARSAIDEKPVAS